MEEKQEIISTKQEMTAGEMLRAARTTGRRKREISTISKMLCIREDFLTALEEGNYNVIPEVVYILGFARSYAVELGLNPDEVINKLKHELGLLEEEKQEAEEEKQEPVVEEEQSVEEEIVAPKIREKTTNNKLLWIIGGVIALIAVVGLILFFVINSNKSARNINELQNSEEEIVETQKEIAFRNPVNKVYPETKSFDVSESRVVLQVVDVPETENKKDDSWLKIEDSKNNLVFALVLSAGDVYYVEPNTKYKAIFGNAGAVDVWVDGHLIKKLGALNERKGNVSLTPDALKAYGFAE